MSYTKLLKANLRAALRSHPEMLPRNSHLLIAVSGGQDSLCLAKLLWMQQQNFNWSLMIAHCDHRWRSDSQANAAYVEQFAGGLEIDFCIRTAKIVPKNESEARKWRYEMLTEMANLHKCMYVVTGHTRSDRVETLLYNLMRGSGSDGLASLTWQRSLGDQIKSDQIKLVRPLLNVSRDETAQFCRENQITVWEDSTNQSLDYRRNRLRLKVIPYLARHFNPQIETAIAQTSELLHGDVIYLEEQASQFFKENITVVWEQRSPRLQRQLLAEQPLALQRRIVRQFLSRYLIHQVNFEDIERFLSLLKAQNRSQSSPFKGHVAAFVDHPWIVLQNQ